MKPLKAAIDMHIHGAPDVVPRKLSDIEIAKQAIKEEMYAIVLKTHLGSTVARAKLADEATNHQIQVCGGISLNSFIGGFNPLALRAALAMGAKIVWMPTFTAKNHLSYERRNKKSVNTLSELCKNLEGLSIFDSDHQIKAEVTEILKLISKANVLLCCGHIGMVESKTLIPLAQRLGIKRIVYNHPNNPINPATLNDQLWLVEHNVILERCIVDIAQNIVDWPTVIYEIRKTGIKNNIISTDLGQAKNITPVEGLKLAVTKLKEYDFSNDEIKSLISDTPKKLLNI